MTKDNKTLKDLVIEKQLRLKGLKNNANKTFNKNQLNVKKPTNFRPQGRGR